MNATIPWSHLMSNIYSTTKYKCSVISVIYPSPSTVSSFSLTCSRNMKRERDSRTICEHTNIRMLILSCFICIPNQNGGFELRCISITQRSDIKTIYYIFEFLFLIMKNCVSWIYYSLIGETFFNVSYFSMTSKSRGVGTPNLYRANPTVKYLL